ncbi:MAG: NADPH-dependent F420 reductase [Deltaproteobacteria bacterium]|nr:NADPH-dependent F420 reductase [Deltaproteobacteria bacterium]
MKVAIIGVGNVGSALAKATITAGHEVALHADHHESVLAAAHKTGARAASSARDAVEGAELVVLAVPYGALRSVVSDLGSSIDGKIVIDVTNPLNASYTGLDTETSAAEEVQAAAPRARVVKAFNTVFASRHARPTESGLPLDAFYAGDDDDAKARVAELAASIGYRPIDVGGLRMARYLEGMAFLNIRLNAGNGWSWQSGWKLVGPTA